MQADRAHFCGTAILIAGVAAGLLSRAAASRQAREIAGLKESLADLESRFEQREAEFARAKARIEEHEARLNDLPSTPQIVAAMENLLGKTMEVLNQRLSTQAESIELLKTTVAQTDALLERVLESLDALRDREALAAAAGPD